MVTNFLGDLFRSCQGSVTLLPIGQKYILKDVPLLHHFMVKKKNKMKNLFKVFPLEHDNIISCFILKEKLSKIKSFD
jgi:hypothetical protein